MRSLLTGLHEETDLATELDGAKIRDDKISCTITLVR